MQRLFAMVIALVVIGLVVYPAWQTLTLGQSEDHDGVNAVYGAEPQMQPNPVKLQPQTTRPLTRRPPTKTRTATRRPTRTPTRYPTFCERNWSRNWHFCGAHSYFSYAEGYGRDSDSNDYTLVFRANKPIRILLDGSGYIDLRIWNSKRTWVFNPYIQMQTLRLPKGTYYACFGTSSGAGGCVGGWSHMCYDYKSCIFNPSGLSGGMEIVVK